MLWIEARELDTSQLCSLKTPNPLPSLALLTLSWQCRAPLPGPPPLGHLAHLYMWDPGVCSEGSVQRQWALGCCCWVIREVFCRSRGGSRLMGAHTSLKLCRCCTEVLYLLCIRSPVFSLCSGSLKLYNQCAPRCPTSAAFPVMNTPLLLIHR